MTDDDIVEKIERDLQRSETGVVVYVEGPTDIRYLPALLGRPDPTDSARIDGVSVVALNGVRNVRRRLELATRWLPDERVSGIIDGDGRPLNELRAPVGNLWSWPAYSIENLLVQCGWPRALGEDPDLPDRLREYTGAVALQRTRVAQQEALRLRFSHERSLPPLTIEEARQRLDLRGSLVPEFERQVAAFTRALGDENLQQAHTMINGKWIVEHLSARISGKSYEDCRVAWADHARVQGHGAVKEIWQAVVG